MNLKKTLALVLALVMTLSLLAGCGGKELNDRPQNDPVQTQPVQTQPVQTEPVQTEPTETLPPETTLPALQEVYEPGTHIDWNAKPISDEGYGRTPITLANGLTFRAGDMLSDLIANGLELDDDDAAVTLAPWAYHTLYFYYSMDDSKSHSFQLYVMNETSEPQNVRDCRIYHASVRDFGASAYGMVAGTTTIADALALTGAEDEYDIVLGDGFNSLEISTSSTDGCVSSFTVTYLAHLLEVVPMEDDIVDDAVDAAILACYGLSGYKSYSDYPTMDQILGIGTLQLTVAGSTLTFGPSGTTMQDMANMGWNLRELDAEDKTLDKNYYLAMFSTPATVGSYEISGFDVRNYSEETMDTMLCPLKGFDVENPLYFKTENEAAAPFDFYGFHAGSTIQDALSLLGSPQSSYVYVPNCEIQLTFKFISAETRTSTLIEVTFNFMTNELIEMSIY